MPQIPCFVVNLATDTARRHAMAERLKQQHINATFFPAVDGRLMPDAELESHVDRQKAEYEYGPLTRAEIGTSLSHIGLYRTMVANNLPYAVILEDEVCLGDDFSQLLNTEHPGSLANVFDANTPVMLQLTHVDRVYRFGTKPLAGSHRTAAKAYRGVWLASGYFITLAAAKSLAAHLYPVWTVADHWNRFQGKGLLQLWALTPPAVWEAPKALQSNLAADRKPRRKDKKTVAQRLVRLFQNLVTGPLLTKRHKNNIRPAK